MTWRDINLAPRHGLGTEKIERSALRVPIPPDITDDVDFLAMRFSGRKAMVGFREQNIFHIVILDHNFTAYDHS
ncbi:MAG: hypothetical protein HYY01_14565 [Chloroflexi bacterium]|nr:hypothetical protein [Chloroflexota bacterium]